MVVIEALNVHDALPVGVRLLKERGVRRRSRNGDVYQIPTPVTTVYDRPGERVLFWPERDANPFFHLYESIWMLTGRNDLKPLQDYISYFDQFSDNGITIHDAYGYRWMHAFGFNQLDVIASRLKLNPDDRRCVLQMWDANADLGRLGKAHPCNLVITFQISVYGKLDIVVFCRSNDAIWGTYGANAVHFSMLQEYMAHRIGVEMGTMTQISVNFHAYTKILDTMPDQFANREINPYKRARHYPMPHNADPILQTLSYYHYASIQFRDNGDPWSNAAAAMLRAHRIWKTREAPARYNDALSVLAEPQVPQDSDWIIAGREWIQRRADKWSIRMAQEQETLGEA